ncbi:acetyl-CoA carboxylase biotin carboxyl carrier protein [Virgibacillus halodenitrificans]|uniref:Biotin carboxyl carrier protein of acetyl-CoA carboxylase n=1 Tax=Virgibacillus halodenitrificans TaxID=1482 RepID=A0AAC9J035_VIRHA|nr:acetyl-CoA carboxylase biotin carboxyl carrier protein [Virgibacillus halodenitrificans]APC48334.1 acetyl-CoA carboxylase, biotin carboxyl carrier protein [Virgibacillus halodenitrificans]MCG1029886.1 acetyl-CoA carboxylase biotin carboxyl carrier protein [Virgibacillus halodenitrificans]MCJ0930899.1 acetyl-CoA carboxylase biotin carboxyl carrier protein [Virgibacillus halodenitrificans]MEC2158398.1 acetyl-CoA carboxylase biotin carboxyl carrier protein [Virgibacillus halodenitrificans]CDQ3
MLKVQEIREIIKLIDQSSINQFTYESNGTTITMEKSAGNTTVQPQNTPVQVVEENPSVQTKEEPTIKEEKPVESHKEETVKEESKPSFDYEITSPMVGTFYSSPSPESGPYVSVGSNVEDSSVVCIVEAMKLFNEIEAEVSGEIVEILVKDGELVEYGQPLFRVNKK